MSNEAPEDAEDFAGKYEDTNPISRRLVDGYFDAVGRLLDEIVPSLPAHAAAHEVGCAEGNSTMRLRRMLPDEVDLSASELVDEQVGAARLANPGLEIIQAAATALPHADEAFDLVFILEVLEHLPQPEVAMGELRRVVRPGGWLVAGVPREPLWRILNFARGKYWSGLGNTPGHIQHWSTDRFSSFIATEFGPTTRVERPIPWTIVSSQRLL